MCFSKSVIRTVVHCPPMQGLVRKVRLRKGVDGRCRGKEGGKQGRISSQREKAGMLRNRRIWEARLLEGIQFGWEEGRFVPGHP